METKVFLKPKQKVVIKKSVNLSVTLHVATWTIFSIHQKASFWINNLGFYTSSKHKRRCNHNEHGFPLFIFTLYKVTGVIKIIGYDNQQTMKRKQDGIANSSRYFYWRRRTGSNFRMIIEPITFDQSSIHRTNSQRYVLSSHRFIKAVYFHLACVSNRMKFHENSL